MAIKFIEHFLYHSQAPRTMTRWGHFRSAIETGSAVFIPNFLQGIDFAATMLRRSDGSPETTDGTSRISLPPSARIFTADQDTNALFTSIWKITRFCIWLEPGDNYLTVSKILSQPSGKCPKAEQGNNCTSTSCPSICASTEAKLAISTKSHKYIGFQALGKRFF